MVTRQNSIFFIGWIMMLFAILLKGCLWILQSLIRLGFLAVGRSQEFQADDYARQIGFNDGLASCLRKTEGLDVQPTGIWAVLSQSHPPTPIRIDRLLKIEN